MKNCGFFAHEFLFLHHLNAYFCINFQKIIKRTEFGAKGYCPQTFLLRRYILSFIRYSFFYCIYLMSHSFSCDTFYRDDCFRPHVQCSKVCVSSLVRHVSIAQQLWPQENHQILKIDDFWSWMEITAKGIECIAKSIALIKQSALVLYQVSVSCGFLLSYYNFGLHYISVSSTQNHSFLHVG